MKLSEKGPFAPPPVLAEPSQTLSSSLAAWPDVHARAHWEIGDDTAVNGADFYVGQEELGHIHLYGEAHVMMPQYLASALIAAGIGERFQWSRNAVVHQLDTRADVAAAQWIFQLNYDRIKGVEKSELLQRIAARAGAAKSVSPT